MYYTPINRPPWRPPQWLSALGFWGAVIICVAGVVALCSNLGF